MEMQAYTSVPPQRYSKEINAKDDPIFCYVVWIFFMAIWIIGIIDIQKTHKGQSSN